MTMKELRKLNRSQLLRLLLDVEKENEVLREENRSLREQLESKELRIAEAGSLAEASLRLSGVFEAAQRAADLYLTNIKSKRTTVSVQGDHNE